MTPAERLLELQARPVLSAAEVHELTGVSVSTVRRAIREGGLPARKLGARVLIPTSAVMSWVGAEQAVAS